MARTVGVAMVLAAVGADGVALSSYDQGAAFDKCINITDFTSKTLADDITLLDRVDGCCPEGTTPGVKHTNQYRGPQVICGFKDDGTIAVSSSTSNGVKTCTYNNCYVFKQNLPCADDTKQLLNGCCAATDAANTGFESDCKNYWSTSNNAWSEAVRYCTTYHSNYGTIGNSGTDEASDDQADGKLVTSNLYTYAPCTGGSGGDAPSPSPPVASTSHGSIGFTILSRMLLFAFVPAAFQ